MAGEAADLLGTRLICAGGLALEGALFQEGRAGTEHSLPSAGASLHQPSHLRSSPTGWAGTHVLCSQEPTARGSRRRPVPSSGTAGTPPPTAPLPHIRSQHRVC